MSSTSTSTVPRLKSLAEIQYGLTAKSSAEKIGPKFLRITDIQNGAGDWVAVPRCEIQEDRKAKFQLAPGDIVFARTGATTGKSCLITEEVDAVFASYLIGVKPTFDNVCSRYLAYYFQTDVYWGHIAAGTEGAAQGGFNASKLGELRVPLPSIDKQKRIVAVLDQAFAALDRARAHVEANLADAEILFLESLRSRFAIAVKTHGAIVLEQLSDHITDGDHQAPPKAETGVPFITISNIDKLSRTIDFSKTFYVPRDYYDKLSAKKRPEYGDILYSVTGSFGIPILVKNYPEFCFQQHIGLIRPRRTVNSDWLYFMLMSPQCLEQADAAAIGTAQRTVSLRTLRSLQVPSSPEADQSADAERISRLYKICFERITLYKEKLSDLAELRRSLLEKAFAGELKN